MLLTITSSMPPATDLGFLLHKHPERMYERELSFGTARVCFPEATSERCTAALLVDVDPVRLVRRRGGPAGIGFSLRQYINDRPYAASSFMSAAIGEVFRTALGGRCDERQDLADRSQPLKAGLPVVPCRGGEPLLRSLFEPLGYAVSATQIPLDEMFPAWGASRYLAVELSVEARLRDLLEHLYVLLPVLDDDKHYWVDRAEVDKLLRRGGAWLGAHPQRELITRRYLRHDRGLTNEALARLLEAEDDPANPDRDRDAGEAAVERTVRLAEQRITAVLAALRERGARRVADLGCGPGALVKALLAEPWVEWVVGLDVAWAALEEAGRRLRLDDMTPRQRARVDLWQGAITYRDRRLRDVDAVVLVEVIEHLDPSRLDAFEDVVFADAHPATVVVTTPNVEYNALFEGLADGRLRHRDHRFEWTRAQFTAWCDAVAERNGYLVAITGIGPVDAQLGSPTQMAVFSA